MKKKLLALAMAVLMVAGVPAAALAWGGEVVEPLTQTVWTPAVTAPITIGDITYVPCEACGGAAGTVPIGTIPTKAVTAPVTVGDVTYVPQYDCWFCDHPWP